MKKIRISILLSIILVITLNGQAGSQPGSLLSADDLTYLKELTKDVMDSSRIYPGQKISSDFGSNSTGGILIRPGGRKTYPSFWIRDYAMSLECGFVSGAEQKHMLQLTASTQCDRTWITNSGSIIPAGAIADHIRIDDGKPIYFPGTYNYSNQGGKTWGAWCRRGLRPVLAPARRHEQRDAAGNQYARRRQPQDQGLPFESRPQQHEFAVARHHVVDHLAVRIAGLEALAHQKAQVAGERRVGIVDRLVLAHHAAQIVRQLTRPPFQHRVGQHLVGLDRERGHACGQCDPERDDPQDAHAAHSAGCSAERPRAGLGAPTRKRRSDSDSTPPNPITSAPIQISRISGL